MKIYITAIIRAKEEFRTEVLALLQDMVKETRKEEACELYRLHQSIEDQNQFIFYEIWRDQEGLAQHEQQLYIQKFKTLAETKLQKKPELYITQII